MLRAGVMSPTGCTCVSALIGRLRLRLGWMLSAGVMSPTGCTCVS
jgi:hypothetical protein